MPTSDKSNSGQLASVSRIGETDAGAPAPVAGVVAALAGVEPGAAGLMAPGRRALVTEGLVVAAVVTGATALVAPDDLGLTTLRPHPVFMAALALAARYGGQGLLTGMGAGLLLFGLTGTAVLGARGAADAAIGFMASGANLGALIAVLLVSWIGSIRERRVTELRAERSALQARLRSSEAAVDELRRVALALRQRTDRLGTSLSFLRDVAERLDGTDPAAAAQAALDLVLARTGARAAVAQIWGDGAARTLAAAGIWSAENHEPPDLQTDRTAASAFASGHAQRASDLPDATADDCEMAAPVQDGERPPIGIIAVRGLSPAMSTAATVHDLEVIGQWTGRSLTPPAPMPVDGQEISGRIGPAPVSEPVSSPAAASAASATSEVRT